MAVVTIDSTDTAAILADAGIEVEAPEPKDEPKPVEKPADKGIAGDEDDEDENGLTAEQRREFTDKMQKTISKKHRQMKEAEEFAADQYNGRRLAEQRAEQLERDLIAERAKSAPKEEAKTHEKPKREDFSNEYEFVDAMIQYGVDERLREKAAEDAKAKAESDKAERARQIGERIDAARKAVEDFDEVVGAVETEIPPAVGTYMEQSDMIAELSYYFAKNPDVLVSLAKLTPHAQLVKVGKIESTLSPFGSQAKSDKTQDDSKSSEAPNGRASQAAPSESDTGNAPSKPRGKAAPVITPLDGTGSAGFQKDSKDMNIREAIEDYQKRNKANLGMRKRH